MNEPPEQPSPAERRLDEHLEIVRATPPHEVALSRRVVHAARRQRGLREPLQVLGTIAQALVDGLAGLLGVRRSRQR